MKTTNNNLDDLIFENRNKAYGAYANRKNYDKYMFWALTGAISLFLLIISVPVIANYIKGNLMVEENPVVVTEVLRRVITEPKDQVLPEAPKTDIVKPVYRFVPTLDTNDLVEIFDLIENAKNPAPVDTAKFVVDDTPVDKPEIIEKAKPETFTIVEEMPEFPGGDAGRLKYLSEHVRYPQAARETGIEGKVYVEFVIDETGKVVEPVVLRGIGGGCDEEALRVVSEMPTWKPGRQTGKAVRVRFSLPIAFKLM